jgi:hypothetical protein
MPRIECPATLRWSDDQRRHLRYLWDDARASNDFRDDGMWLLALAEPCSLSALMALCIGYYECVVWRFEGLHTRREPTDLIEAAWHEMRHPGSLALVELDRDEWQGPVLGPLWCAMTWLNPALVCGADDLGEVADGLQYLGRLAQHVAPDPSRVRSWLGDLTANMAAAYPRPRVDPFDRLFAEAASRPWGQPVDREALGLEAFVPETTSLRGNPFTT